MLIPENYVHWHLQDLQTLKDASLEKSTLKANKSINATQVKHVTILKMQYSCSLLSTVLCTNVVV